MIQDRSTGPGKLEDRNPKQETTDDREVNYEENRNLRGGSSPAGFGPGNGPETLARLGGGIRPSHVINRRGFAPHQASLRASAGRQG